MRHFPIIPLHLSLLEEKLACFGKVKQHIVHMGPGTCRASGIMSFPNDFGLKKRTSEHGIKKHL